MKVFLTGGAGYIGSNTASWLVSQGHEVTVYDNLLHGNLKAIPERVEFIEGDIGDSTKLAEVLTKDVDVVIHFAALIEAGESMKFPDLYTENNVSKGKILLDSIARAGIKRVIFSSSAAVYSTQDRPIKEEDPKVPVSVYGKTKLDFEELLKLYETNSGLKFCALRYFNASGACINSPDGILRGEAHTPESHLIPNIMKAILEKKDKFVIFGGDYDTPDGTAIRDYIHINDLADAHILAAERLLKDETKSEAFNVGTGVGYSNKEMLETAIRVTGSPISYELGERRSGDATRLVADASKIKKVLGWKPKYSSIDNIVNSAWEWHKNFPNGY